MAPNCASAEQQYFLRKKFITVIFLTKCSENIFEINLVLFSEFQFADFTGTLIVKICEAGASMYKSRGKKPTENCDKYINLKCKTVH